MSATVVEVVCTATKKDGTPCKGSALPDSPFCRWHQEGASLAPDESGAANQPVPKPSNDLASWKGPRGHRMQPSSREIKMLRPVCRQCEEAVGGKKYLEPLWFERCEHDPYVSYGKRIVDQPIYEPVDPNDPKGPQRIVRVEQIEITEPHPNWTQVTLAGGFNKGRGVEKALKKGFIYPQQLVSPLYPNGIKRRCQFRGCFAEDVKRYVNGWFCREQEAKLVRISDQESTYQVSFDNRSAKLQADQLNAIAVNA